MNALSLEAAASQQTTLPLPAGLTRIVLTGFMGSGKSTIGRRLAQAIGWHFVDLDDAVEALAGISVPEIFATLGEPAMRRLESRALARALAQPNTVIALGGGAPETLTNRLLIEQTVGTAVLFLDAPFPVLYDRCMLQALNPAATTRPNLADPQAAESRFRLRQPLYRRIAHHTLDASALAIEDAVPTLLALLNRNERKLRA